MRIFTAVALLLLKLRLAVAELRSSLRLNDAVRTPLTLTFPELAAGLEGTGRAKAFWAQVREGVNPLTAALSGETANDNGVLSLKVRDRLRGLLGEGGELFPTEITEETLSSCGTRKMLQRLGDGQAIESVLIPSYKHDRTTLCVSTQVGCDRGCAFCLTGKMGLMRSLTGAEIVSQVFRGLQVSRREGMPLMTNVVFMGMGDAGRNLGAVGEAVACMTDRDRLSMAQSKITVSTVGPAPETFMEIAKMPCTIAWSLHSPDDAVRKLLVPSTRHTTAELRDGLLAALSSRPNLRHRTIMIALTLIDGINDSEADALKVVSFVRPMLAVAPKVALDLIPYNDINVASLNRPSKERVNAFQRVLRENGLFCSVRVTRGDEESSACGMLATTERATKRMQKSPATSTATSTEAGAEAGAVLGIRGGAKADGEPLQATVCNGAVTLFLNPVSGQLSEGKSSSLSAQDLATLQRLIRGQGPPAEEAGVELLEWLADDGVTVLCKAVPRGLIVRLTLLHRGVGVLVLSSDGHRVFCHQRSKDKRVFPGLFDMLVGGVSAPGEEAKATLKRELSEETGISLSQQDEDEGRVRRVGSCRVQTEYNYCLVECFGVTCTADQERGVEFKDGEISWGEFVTPLRLEDMLREEKFVPDGLQVWSAVYADKAWVPGVTMR